MTHRVDTDSRRVRDVCVCVWLNGSFLLTQCLFRKTIDLNPRKYCVHPLLSIRMVSMLSQDGQKNRSMSRMSKCLVMMEHSARWWPVVLPIAPNILHAVTIGTFIDYEPYV